MKHNIIQRSTYSELIGEEEWANSSIILLENATNSNNLIYIRGMLDFNHRNQIKNLIALIIYDPSGILSYQVRNLPGESPLRQKQFLNLTAAD